MEALILLFVIPAALVGIFAFFRWAIRRERRAVEKVIASWKELAREIGGRFHDATGRWYARKPFKVTASVDGLELELDYFQHQVAHATGVETGQGHGLDPFQVERATGAQAGQDLVLDYFYTQVGQTPGAQAGQVPIPYTRVTMQVSSSASLRVHARHALSGVESMLGLQDLKVGDAAYDEAFVIKASDERWLRESLTADLRRIHLQHPGISLRLKDGRLVATHGGLVSDPDTLRAMVKLAAAGARSFR